MSCSVLLVPRIAATVCKRVPVKKPPAWLFGDITKAFIVYERKNSQRHLEESRMEREGD